MFETRRVNLLSEPSRYAELVPGLGSTCHGLDAEMAVTLHVAQIDFYAARRQWREIAKSGW